PALLVWNERTMVSLRASLASWLIGSPKSTPGIGVRTVSVTVRMPSGASGLGSKVSNWLGPPCWNRKITDLPLTWLAVWLAARARAANNDGSDRHPRLPMVRKPRRLMACLPSQRVSMACPFADRWGQEGRSGKAGVGWVPRAVFRGRL